MVPSERSQQRHIISTLLRGRGQYRRCHSALGLKPARLSKKRSIGCSRRALLSLPSLPGHPPLVLVPKPDEMLRFCVNHRKLNAITVRDTYPIPRMDKCIYSLRSAKIFSTLDCNSGYRQIPIAEKDRMKQHSSVIQGYTASGACVWAD